MPNTPCAVRLLVDDAYLGGERVGEPGGVPKIRSLLSQWFP